MPFAQAADARIFYTRTGTGPAVLLLQGVGVIGAGWTPQIDGLSSRFTIVAPDNRGALAVYGCFWVPVVET